MTKHVLGIVGSLRKDSFNKKLAETARHLAEEFELEIVTLNNIPPFNQDDELDPAESVKVLRQKVREADGLWLWGGSLEKQFIVLKQKPLRFYLPTKNLCAEV